MNIAKRSFLLIGVVALLMLLNACGGPRTRVIDTPETRELAGWQKPYEVDGQRYQPLRSHHGFKQRGVASWYGRKFHGRKTSNGETYNMYGLSAAHKTLPMGVYVKVTRLDNGHTITVRVNDRGPFVAGRIIDLSYGGAKQLGIVDSGTTRVEVEALGFKEQGQVVYKAPVDYDRGSFAVQIGAFGEPANANRLAEQMRSRYGHSSVSAVLMNGRTVYRVRVGQFTSLERAESVAAELTSGGYQGSFVVAFD